MEFFRPKKKALTVPIIPLIDILVTLLFFFLIKMTNMTEKQKRSVLKVSLPTAGSLKVRTIADARSILSLDGQGNAEIDGLPVAEGLLKEYLVGNRTQRPGGKLELRADEGCPWGKIIEAHSAVMLAGYTDNEVVYRVKRPKELPAETETE